MSEDRPGVLIDDGIRAFPPRPDRVMMMMLEDQGAYGQQDLFLAVLPATEAVLSSIFVAVDACSQHSLLGGVRACSGTDWSSSRIMWARGSEIN